MLQDEYAKLYSWKLSLHAIELTSTMADSIIEYSAPSGIALPYMNRRIMSLSLYGTMTINYFFLRINKDPVMSQPAASREETKSNLYRLHSVTAT
jgi:hypothetical protein